MMVRALLALLSAARAAQLAEGGAAAASTGRDWEGGCTSLGITAGAMVDGSTVVTHGNDCKTCDFRLAYVPSRDYEAGSAMPVYMAKNDYPRFLGPGFSNSYLVQNTDNPFSFNYPLAQPMGHIAQASHTFAYVDGAYAIMNEHQLSIGESTCDARLGHMGIPRAFGGDALFDAAALSRVALQRCATARCAVQLMGDLAEEYGFYPGQLPDWQNGPIPKEKAQAEGGEALIVGDGKEVWVFNVSPDDRGHSAVWAAQRVPDGHLTAITNTFSVGELDLQDKANYLTSRNLEAVATRVMADIEKEQNQNQPGQTTKAPSHASWFGGAGKSKIDFTKLFRAPGGHQETVRQFTYKDRRKWEIFRRVCPSCNFDPYVKHATDDSDVYLPFSVPVRSKLQLEDVFGLHRDLFQGTPFDMTTAPIDGPWGDPVRAKVPDVPPFNTTPEWKGAFERSISQVWTSYTAVSQSRKHLPEMLGGRIWFGPHAPVTTLFAPIYPGAGTIPPALERGSLNKADTNSLYWACCIVNNYMSRFFNFLLPNVYNTARDAEGHLQALTGQVEAQAVQLSSPLDQILTLQELHRNVGAFVLGRWWDLFFELSTYMHDAQMFYPGVTLRTEQLTYPVWYLNMVGPEGARFAEYNDQHPDPNFRPVHPAEALWNNQNNQNNNQNNQPARAGTNAYSATWDSQRREGWAARQHSSSARLQPVMADAALRRSAPYQSAPPVQTLSTMLLGTMLALGTLLGLLLSRFAGALWRSCKLRPQYIRLT